MKQALYVKPSQFEPLEARIAPASFAVGNNSGDINTADSLPWAVNQAYFSPGADTITFASSLEGATITLNSTLLTSQSLTIKGLGSDKLTIDGNGNRIFFAYDNGSPTCTTLSLSGLKLTNADNAIWSSENLILTDTILSGNSTAFSGGAIEMLGSSSSGTPKLIIKDSQIFDNQATGNGGGIYAKNVSEIQITNSIISGNTGTGAGGLFFALSSSSFTPYLVGKMTIKDSQITNNTGGGIFSNAERADIKILNTATSANNGFGTSITMVAGKLTVDKSSFVENSGSGLIVGGTAVQSTTLKNSFFSSNGGHGIDVNLYTSLDNKSSFTADKITVANNGDSGLKGNFTGTYGNSATISIKNSDFLQNETTTSGGGIRLTGGFTGAVISASILNSQISGNSAVNNGGGLYTIGLSKLTLSKATVVGNSATYGAGISNGTTVTKISGSTFIGNSASNKGGAVHISYAEEIAFEKNVFEGNTAVNNGGAIYVAAAAQLTVNSSLFTGNAAANGGAMGGYSAELKILKSTFLENTAASSGGAIYVNPAVLLISGSTFTGNTANLGGAVRASSPDGIIEKSTFSKNFASSVGGAVYNTGTLAINSCSIVDNISLVTGGGVANTLGHIMTLTGGTITGNVAAQGVGGGIYSSPMAISTTVTGTKVSGNSATSPAFANASLGVTIPTVVVKSTSGNFIVNDDGDLDDGVADNGFTTLREALNLAYLSGKSATIGFDADTMAGHTILVASELQVKSDVKIVGLGTDQLVVHGNNATRIFRVQDNDSAVASTVSISGLTLTHGDTSASGAGIYNLENLAVSNVVVMNGTSTNDAGGIYSNGKLAVSNSKFVYNICGASSSDYGGALLAVTSSSITISNSLFAANTAGAEGGAIKLRLEGAKASILIDNSALLKNNAGTFSVSKAGAGAYISGGATSGAVTIKNTLISGNNGGSKVGGGIYFEPGAAYTVTKWTLDNVLAAHNTAGKGGGLAMLGAYKNVPDTLVINKSKFLHNDATGPGGAINIEFPVTAILQSSLIAGNTASDGGGLKVSNTDITMKGMKFFANTADTNNGGGVSLGSSVTATISGSAFVGNNATGYGGGLHANQDDIIAKNVNFLGNRSGSDGGGLNITANSTLDLSGSKIIGNHSASNGGGFAATNGDEVLFTKNSVLANYAGGFGGGMDVRTTSGNFTMTSGSVSSNSGFANAGGINAVTGLGTTFTINGTLISRNTANSYGGGLALDGAGEKHINKATISENFTPYTGGGIYLLDGSLTLTSGLISHNMANVAGGGFGMTNSLPLTINGAKFNQNFAPFDPNISPPI